jgi:hypothetical protein
MEAILLPLFQCHVSVPTRYEFAMRFCDTARLSVREKSLVTFLLELSFLDYNLNYFLPSRVAAGAVHLAIQVQFQLPAAVRLCGCSVLFVVRLWRYPYRNVQSSDTATAMVRYFFADLRTLCTVDAKRDHA